MDWSLTLSGFASGDESAAIDDLFESFKRGVVSAGHGITGGAISSTKQVAAVEAVRTNAEVPA